LRLAKRLGRNDDDMFELKDLEDKPKENEKSIDLTEAATLEYPDVYFSQLN
jgi:hypothetical protein